MRFLPQQQYQKGQSRLDTSHTMSKKEQSRLTYQLRYTASSHFSPEFRMQVHQSCFCARLD